MSKILRPVWTSPSLGSRDDPIIVLVVSGCCGAALGLPLLGCCMRPIPRGLPPCGRLLCVGVSFRELGRRSVTWI